MVAEMTIAIVIIGDGRDGYLRQCVGTLGQLYGPVSERWMYDDSGEPEYRRGLVRRYPRWRHIDGGSRQGCAGAFQQVWRQVAAETQADFVFLIEQDFRFVRPVDLDSMSGLLDERPYLAEVALLRQPWNSEEKRAGGIVEWHPDWYVDMSDGRGRHWLEHRSFTTNPCLFRRSLLDVPWPDSRPGAYSEGIFSHQIHEKGTPEVPGEQVRCAYWGRRGSGVWVEHIGHQRIGMGY
jgi:hypothetical protein